VVCFLGVMTFLEVSLVAWLLTAQHHERAQRWYVTCTARRRDRLGGERSEIDRACRVACVPLGAGASLRTTSTHPNSSPLEQFFDSVHIPRPPQVWVEDPGDVA
jgi:hypothetical protein